MAYASTLATYGVARGVVVGTGETTEIGRISELIAGAEVLATPLTRKMAHFSRLLLYIIVGLAGVTFVVGILRGESWLDMFMAAVALAVGAIPEGLPAAMTITLAIGVGRMAKRNVIVRKLPAVETLGSTTVICSDKTGTLTQNQMTVRMLFSAGREVRVSGIGYAPVGSFDPAMPEGDRSLVECLRAGLLCNDSRVERSADGWQVEGDPTEGALITVARKAGLSWSGKQGALPRLDAIPFESQHQYMATLHHQGAGAPRIAYLKGSIESLLPRCDQALGASGEAVPFDPIGTQRVAEQWAATGIRVLAFARAEFSPEQDALSHSDVSSELTFLGLQGMLDPPRPEAVVAVAACKSAGIRVKMITGDHAGTATAIAREMGLDGGDASALAGAAIAALSDSELTRAAERTAVFARVSPEQKLRLVEALQAGGHVVAMTGDGVNDAPALRRADIGVAMGRSGTEVAKEAADMVLTDDNFASIEAAVEEGRGVFDNLTKFILWTLPTNIGEGLVILTAVFAGVALPILPVQILWINMTTAVLLGLMLAFEPKEGGIMRRPPRDPMAPILTPPLLLRIGFVGVLLLVGSFGLFEWALQSGAGENEARTVAVNVFVMGELFYLFGCRSLTRSMFSLGVFSNRWLLLGVAATILLQLGLTYLPAMNAVFHTAPIGLDAWGLATGVGVTIYAVVGFEKALRRRSSRLSTP
jgi:Ca2+-transporting ATPase